MKHAYLLHTGYGKTKLCLDKIMASPRKPRTLLISTKNIVESAWSSEIDKWYPNQISYAYITGSIKESDRINILTKEYDILAMNTEMLDWYIKNTTSVKRKAYTKQGPKLYYNDTELIDRFDLIIIDEVSLFKNSQSQRFKLIKKWCYQVRNVIILSATPTPKNIEDIWSQIYLLDGGQRLGKNITAFREDYAIAISMSNGRNRYQYSQEATDEVLKLIKDISTSVPEPKKALFPEPIIKKLMIKPDEATANLLEEFKTNYITQLSNGNNLIAFSKNQLMLKINQIANGNVYNKGMTVELNNLKLRVIEQKVNMTSTPILIVYNYVFDKDNLLKLPGARLLSTKKDFDDWNNNKIKIGVLSPFSASHGLNLQESNCRDIIWFSPIWDTEKWIQTNARVCRRGQVHQITISVLLLKGSFDQYAFNICQDKFRTQFNNLKKLS